MLQYFIKVTISALLIVAISEISKRQSGVAALLASLPITSLLAFVWLYLETGNTDTISELSRQIFWLVIPSLILFLALPVLLRWGWGFWFSLAMACGFTSVTYLLMIQLLHRFGFVL